MSRNGHGLEATSASRKQASPVTLGWIIFAMLILLTVLEYFVFLWVDRNLPLMIAMNVLDAALIMVYFMHLPRVWRAGEDD